MKVRPDLAALAICALALGGVILLAALRVPQPEVLTTIAFAALTAGAGIAYGGASTSSTSAATPPLYPSAPLYPAAPAPLEPAKPDIPAQPVYSSAAAA